MHNTISIHTYPAPVTDDIRDGVYHIYRKLFGEEEVNIVSDIFTGAEAPYSRNSLVVASDDTGKILGTSLASQDIQLPMLGSMNGVGVLPEARGQKIAERCCSKAVELLDVWGVRGSFLATGNPLAARLYQRLGFRFLSCSSLMLRLNDSSDDSFAFMKDLYDSPADTQDIRPGDAGCRMAMIPLVVSCADTHLDPLVNLFGTPISLVSCQGLYPRYSELASAKNGQWFQLRNDSGAMIAIGTIKPMSNSNDGHWLNVMAHPAYPQALKRMTDYLLNLPDIKKGRVCFPVSDRDTIRTELLKDYGLTHIGTEHYSFGKCLIQSELYG